MLTRAQALKQFAAFGGVLLLGGDGRRRRHEMSEFMVPVGQLEPAPDVAAGIPTTGVFIDAITGSPTMVPTSDGPSILQTWLIQRIALPISMFAKPGGANNPTTCNFTLAATIFGSTVWQLQTSISLVTTTIASTTYVMGSSLVADDLINPFDLRAGQKLGFNASAIFDQQAVAISIFLGSGEEVTPSSVSYPTIPGTVRYTTLYDPRLRGRR